MATARKQHSSNGVASLEEWKGRRTALATLPTGLKVRLRSVTLDELAADEALPDDLVAVAVNERTGLTAVELARRVSEDTGSAREYSQQILRLRDKLVLRAVVEPDLTEADLDEVDPFDKDMVANIASRQTDVDATGRRVWGVEPLNTFQVFRDKHGCVEGCAACEATVLEFSQVQ